MLQINLLRSFVTAVNIIGMLTSDMVVQDDVSSSRYNGGYLKNNTLFTN